MSDELFPFPRQELLVLGILVNEEVEIELEIKNFPKGSIIEELMVSEMEKRWSWKGTPFCRRLRGNIFLLGFE